MRKSVTQCASYHILFQCKSQFNHKFEFPDLIIVDLGPNFIKIGSEMTILEP